MVADRLLEHSELGFRLVGFVDDRAACDRRHRLSRPAACSAALPQVPEICAQEQIDEIYVALPIDEHVKMLGVVEFASRECHQRPRRAGPAAVHRAARAARGPRRPADHQHQRRAAARLQQRAQARRRHGDLAAWSCSSARSPALIDRAADQAQLAGSGVLHAGAHGPRRQARSRSTSSARCRWTPRTPAARSGRATTTRGRRRSAAGCAATTSTSCRSSGTSCAATCRSSGRGPSGRSSSSSSSTAFRSTCSATR